DGGVGARLDLLHGPPALHAGIVGFRRLVAVARIVVAFLDEEPVLALAPGAILLHAHEHPIAFEAVAVQPEFEVALGKAFVGVTDRLPGAAVPDHHRAAAIFAFGNDALEAAIFERVVLGPHRKPLLVGV